MSRMQTSPGGLWAEVEARARLARRSARPVMENAERIVAVLADYRGMPLTVNELASELYLTPSTVRRNLETLLRAGLVCAREGDRHTLVYYVELEEAA